MATAIAEGRPSRGIDVITGPAGDVVGFSISPVMQLYSLVDGILSQQRLVAFPIAERFAFAGKVAAVPAEHARLVEKLLAAISTSLSEAGALNAVYLLEICRDLVPGFKGAIADGRLEKAAELSPFNRVQAVIMLGEKPSEWALAESRDGAQVVLLQQDLEDESDLLGLGNIVEGTGRAVGDATKFVGGAAFGGVGLVTDTLGITSGAEDQLTQDAEDVVDLVGHGVGQVVSSLDEGLDGTAEDLRRKGLVGAVGDGVADAADLVSDFVGDAVQGIASGVTGILDWVAGDVRSSDALVSHKVAIVVAELFGEERSLGLRIENRVVTAFTKPEASRLGWILGDCIIGIGPLPFFTQDAMLAAIAEAKEALKTSGTPIRFLVERHGQRPVR